MSANATALVPVKAIYPDGAAVAAQPADKKLVLNAHTPSNAPPSIVLKYAQSLSLSKAAFGQAKKLTEASIEVVAKARAEGLAKKLKWKKEDGWVPLDTVIETLFFQLASSLKTDKVLTHQGHVLFLRLINRFKAFPFHPANNKILGIFKQKADPYCKDEKRWAKVAKKMVLLERFCTNSAFAGEFLKAVLSKEEKSLDATNRSNDIMPVIRHHADHIAAFGDLLFTVMENFAEVLSSAPTRQAYEELLPFVAKLSEKKEKKRAYEHLSSSLRRIFTIRKKYFFNHLLLFKKSFSASNHQRSLEEGVAITATFRTLSLSLVKFLDFVTDLVINLSLFLPVEFTSSVCQEEFDGMGTPDKATNCQTAVDSFKATQLRDLLFLYKTLQPDAIGGPVACRVTDEMSAQEKLDAQTEQDLTRSLLAARDPKIIARDKAERAEVESRLKARPDYHEVQKLLKKNYRIFCQLKAQVAFISYGLVNFCETVSTLNRALVGKEVFYPTPSADIEQLCREMGIESRLEQASILEGFDSKTEASDYKDSPIDGDDSVEVPCRAAAGAGMGSPVGATATKAAASPNTVRKHIKSLCLDVEKSGSSDDPYAAHLALKEVGYHLRVLGSSLDLLGYIERKYPAEAGKSAPLRPNYLSALAFTIVRSASLVCEQLLTAKNLVKNKDIINLPHSLLLLESRLKLCATFDVEQMTAMRTLLEEMNGGSEAHRYTREVMARFEQKKIAMKPSFYWLTGTTPNYTDLLQLGINTLSFVIQAYPFKSAYGSLTGLAIKTMDKKDSDKTPALVETRRGKLKELLLPAFKDLTKLIAIVEVKITAYSKTTGTNAKECLIAWKMVSDHLTGLQNNLHLWETAVETRFLDVSGEATWARLQLIDESIGKALYRELYGTAHRGHNLSDLRDLCHWTSDEKAEKAAIKDLDIGSGLQLPYHHLHSYKKREVSRGEQPRSLTWRQEAVIAAYYGDDFDEGFEPPEAKKVKPGILRMELITQTASFLKMTLQRFSQN